MLPPPSILKSGDGLFGTHVTLEDVNAAIQKQMHTENKLTSDSLMNVIGDGNGFSSCVILIDCQWATPTEHLSKKMIIKIVSFAHILGLVEKAKNEGLFKVSKEDEIKMCEHFETGIQKMHNQEINFYDVLNTGNSENMLTPKVYFSQRFSDSNSIKGFIGMEYIEGSEVRHNYETCTIEEIQPVLKAIAFIQALTLKTSENDLLKIKEGSCFKETLRAMMNGDGMKGVFGHTRRADPERFPEIIERIEGYGPKLLDFEKAFNLNGVVGINKDVFVHGDLWAANVLWTRAGNGSYSAKKILDYQMTHMGNPAEDLVRCLTSILSGADRRKHWEKLLERFYQYFLDALEGCQTEVPYTLDQLKQSYRLYFPVGGLALLPLFGPAVDMKMQFMDKPQADEYRKIVIEKIECLLEDVEKFYLESIV